MPGDPARHPSGPLRVPALFLTALWAEGWRDLHRGGAPLLHTSDVIADAEGWGDAPSSSRMPGDPARHPSGPLRVPALFLTALWAEGWRDLHRGGAPLLHTSDVIADAEGWGDAPSSSRMPGDPARHPSGPLRVPALFL